MDGRLNSNYHATRRDLWPQAALPLQ
jgi:hypothetical protein